MTSAAFGAFREPPLQALAVPRLPQLCGCFMGLGMSLNFFAVIVSMHMLLKLNQYEDGVQFIKVHGDVLPIPRSLLLAGGLAVCYGKAVLSFTIYRLPAALLTSGALALGAVGVGWLARHMKERELSQ